MYPYVIIKIIFALKRIMYNNEECMACHSDRYINYSTHIKLVCGICLEEIMTSGVNCAYDNAFYGFIETGKHADKKFKHPVCDKCKKPRNVLFWFPICSEHLGYTMSDPDDY